MKVWAFNCFGICIKLLPLEKINEWNETHPLFNEKICSYRYHDEEMDKANGVIKL